MFALCHFKDGDIKFVLFDKKDIKETTQYMGIEVETEFEYEEFDRDYSRFPLMSISDLIIRTMNKRARTTTHVLDEIGISCWMAIKQEYAKIQEKKSYLSRSQRDLVEKQYQLVKDC